MPPGPLPSALDRFIDLMAEFSTAWDVFVASHEGGGSVDEQLRHLGQVRAPAREARALLQELTALGARDDAIEDVDSRLQALDLAIDRYTGLARDGLVEDAAAAAIGEHAAYLWTFANNLRKRRDGR
jgi:hypothetical protein